MPPSPICCNSLYGPMTVPGISVDGFVHGRAGTRHGRFKKLASTEMVANKFFDFAVKIGIASTGLREEGGTRFGRLDFDGCRENVLKIGVDRIHDRFLQDSRL